MTLYKIRPATNVVENEGDHWKTVTGPGAIEALRLRQLIVGLKLEEGGMRVSRGVNCRKLAKETTGLKTNDRAKLAERLKEMYNAQLAKCLVINDGE